MPKSSVNGGIKTYHLTKEQERDLYEIAKKNGHNTLKPFVEMVLNNLASGNIVNTANLIQGNVDNWEKKKNQ